MAKLAWSVISTSRCNSTDQKNHGQSTKPNCTTAEPEPTCKDELVTNTPGEAYIEQLPGVKNVVSNVMIVVVESNCDIEKVCQAIEEIGMIPVVYERKLSGKFIKDEVVCDKRGVDGHPIKWRTSPSEMYYVFGTKRNMQINRQMTCSKETVEGVQVCGKEELGLEPNYKNVRNQPTARYDDDVPIYTKNHNCANTDIEKRIEYKQQQNTTISRNGLPRTRIEYDHITDDYGTEDMFCPSSSAQKHGQSETTCMDESIHTPSGENKNDYGTADDIYLYQRKEDITRILLDKSNAIIQDPKTADENSSSSGDESYDFRETHFSDWNPVTGHWCYKPLPFANVNDNGEQNNHRKVQQNNQDHGNNLCCNIL